MKSTTNAPTVEMIALDDIDVVNPRVRNRKVFKEIVDNISALGLKRPITVARRTGATGRPYELVCGQGRLEAWCEPYSGYHLYYPSRRQPSAAFTLLVDALKYRGE